MKKTTFLRGSALRKFFENSPQAMWVYDLSDLRFLAVNKAACDRYGYTEDEFRGMTLLDIRSREEADRLKVVMDKIRAQGASSVPVVWEHRTKSGRIVMVEVLSNIIEIGAIQAGIAVLRDVTEAHSQAEKLATSEANLAWAQQISHLGSWSLDVATEVFALSDEYYRITGFEPGGYEPTWENIVARVHPEDRGLVDQGARRINSATWTPEELEVRIVRPGGEIRHVHSFVDATFNADGSPKLMHGTIQDITDRKNAEEVRTWLAEIVSSSGEAIIGSSLAGLVLSWNKAAEKLFGYTAAEMTGQHLIKLVPPKRWQEAEVILNRLRKGESLPEFETERMDRRGRIFEASFMISPIRSNEGRLIGAAVICRDISSRKAAERQLAIKICQLTALRNIDISITGTSDLETTLEVVVTQALATVDIEAVCLFIDSQDSGIPRVAASRTKTGAVLEGHRLKQAQELAIGVLEKGRMASTGLVGASFLGHADRSEDVEIWDAHPLIAKGDVVGVLAVHYLSGVKRPAEQFHFLDTLSGQAAIAVESAKLFRDLHQSRDDLVAAYDETLEGWARALDLRDKETEGHSVRVTELTMRMASLLKLPEADMPHIRRGALLHDIGKLGVPDQILLKPGPLTDEEWILMRKHPVYGRDILAPIAFLQPALDIPYFHHEKWDGSGYPEGLAGEQIPLAARVFALADVWDALRSDRPYRDAWPVERVKEYFEAQMGTHFDPRLTPVFLKLVCG